MHTSTPIPRLLPVTTTLSLARPPSFLVFYSGSGYRCSTLRLHRRVRCSLRFVYGLISGSNLRNPGSKTFVFTSLSQYSPLHSCVNTPGPWSVQVFQPFIGDFPLRTRTERLPQGPFRVGVDTGTTLFGHGSPERLEYARRLFTRPLKHSCHN